MATVNSNTEIIPFSNLNEVTSLSNSDIFVVQRGNNAFKIQKSNVNICASQITGTVPVSKGGTNRTSLTSGSFLVGNGTSDVTLANAATARNCIGLDTTDDVTFNDITSNSGEFIYSNSCLCFDTTLSISLYLNGTQKFQVTPVGSINFDALTVCGLLDVQGSGTFNTSIGSNCGSLFICNSSALTNGVFGYGAGSCSSNVASNIQNKFIVGNNSSANDNNNLPVIEVTNCTTGVGGSADSIFLGMCGSNYCNVGLHLCNYQSDDNGYDFIVAGNCTDSTAFVVDGQGCTFVTGGTVGNSADYAEYFEWLNGNPSNNTWYGHTVTLSGDKIVNADDETNPTKIIGVVSPRPFVVGDSAWNSWNDKYLKNEFGEKLKNTITYVTILSGGGFKPFKKHELSTYNIDLESLPLSVIGETYTKDENILNPAYDPDQTYIPREERSEWSAIGLVGKLRVCNTQPVNPSWICMRQINADIDEYLVR